MSLCRAAVGDGSSGARGRTAPGTAARSTAFVAGTYDAAAA